MGRIAGLFSFRGRATRLQYWRVFLGSVLGSGLVLGLTFAVISAGGPGAPAFALMLPILAASVAVGARRLHDRGKSAWWLAPLNAGPFALQAVAWALLEAPEPSPPAALVALALNLGGLALSIWALVEIGFLRGTPGPNRYGEAV